MIFRRIVAAVALLCAPVIPAHAQTYNPITNPAYAGDHERGICVWLAAARRVR